MTKTIVINIDWAGPITLSEIKDFQDGTDYGVYQIYGRHPVYGTLPGTLLYIGKASDRTFGERIPEHSWGDWVGKTAQVFVGRLAGEQQPSNEAWEKLIAEAEKLLIFAHAPSGNTQCIRDFKDVRNLHILNWGNYGQLLPEVSWVRYQYDNNLPEGNTVFISG